MQRDTPGRDRSCAGTVGLNARPARVDGGLGCQLPRCEQIPHILRMHARSSRRGRAAYRGRRIDSEGVGVPDQAPLMAMRLRIIDVMVIEEGSSVEHNSLVGEFARVDLTAFI